MTQVDLRHTFATLSLESGMNVKTLSAMLGHVSATTTLDIYTHVTGDMQSEAAAKIDRGPVSYTHLDVYKRQVLAKTKRECQEKLKQLRETVTGSRTEKVRPEMPFGEWLDFWYQTYVKPQFRPTTQANYEAKIYQHIIPEPVSYTHLFP